MSARSLTLLTFVVLLAASIVSLFAGRVWLSVEDVVLGFGEPDSLAGLILYQVRLPRLVLAIGVGASLGLAGAVLQGLLRNPLAESGLLGISAGAALGAVIAIYYGLATVIALATPILGLLGGLLAAAIAFALSRGGGTLALILAGSAVSSMAAAGLALALNLAPSPYAAFEITIWLLGSLTDRSWDHVWLAAPFMLIGCGLLLLTRQAIDALALGEAQAESLGVNVSRVRLIALLGTALAVGAATAVTGAIGFIGLVAPHLVRPLVGHQPGRTLIPAALLGAALLLIADIGTRELRLGSEIKLGVLTALVGAPFFLWLVLHLRRKSP